MSANVIISPYPAASGIVVSGPGVLDLEADAGLSGLSDSDPITTWLDQSGTGRNGTGVADGGVSKPIYKTSAGPGGLPCVRCAGDTANAFNRTGFSLASDIPVSNYT